MFFIAPPSPFLATLPTKSPAIAPIIPLFDIAPASEEEVLPMKLPVMESIFDHAESDIVPPPEVFSLSRKLPTIE